MKPIITLVLVFNLLTLSAQRSKCLIINFCDTCCHYKLIDSLKAFRLRKGDFFTVKIRNINPYRYNINIVGKSDTLKPGNPPVLIAEFTDPTKLAGLVASLKQVSNDASIALQENREKAKLSDEKKQEQRLMQMQKDIANANNNADKHQIEERIYYLEDLYSEFVNCYNASIRVILDAQVDCINKNACSSHETCICMDAMKDDISKIISIKNELIHLIEAEMEDASVDADVKQKYRDVLDNLKSQDYTSIYLQKVYNKAYSNFLIAQSETYLSTYSSFPIQVTGDRLVLKIDITPKTSSEPVENSQEQVPAVKKDNDKDSDEPTPATTSVTKLDVGSNIVLPDGARTLHLNYTFRTSQLFYGFSSGFFVDWLADDNYASRAVAPTNTATTYMLVKENNQSPNKYGIMASINAGRYFGKSSAFIQVFAGPGLSLENPVKPCLLTGLGFGFGETNKLSLNGGVAIGEVKRLSNAYSTSEQYSTPPANLYYSSVRCSFFVSVNYVFGIVNKDKTSDSADDK